MIKFYVLSGKLREIVLAENETEACIVAVRRNLDSYLPDKTDHFFFVDKRGFREGSLFNISFDEQPSTVIPATFIYEKMKGELG